jgi:hypothetical protein
VGHTDDEEDEDGLSPNGSSSKKKKNGGKDDAWVDILVATQDRKMGNQAAEMRTGPRMPRGIDPSTSVGSGAGGIGGMGRMDEVPDVVRENTPPPMRLPPSSDIDELDAEPIDGSQTASIMDRESSHFEEGDEGEEEEEASLADGDTENDSEVSYPRPQQRRAGMGYFDLHPDRRPQTRQQQEPQQRLYQQQQVDLRQLDDFEEPRRPFANDDESVTRDSMDSSAREDLEEHIPYPHKYGNGTVPSPAPGSSTSTFTRRSDMAVPPLQPKLRVLPKPPVPAPAPAPVEPPKPSGSKTASLIEMYRQREQQGTQGSSSSRTPAPLVIPRGPLPKPQQQQPPVIPSTSLASSSSSQLPTPPSRLPVRSDSVPKASSPVSDISTTTSPSDLYDDESLPEPPKVSGTMHSGLDSPGRYVHGAPLHNVIEEEEEEE